MIKQINIELIALLSLIIISSLILTCGFIKIEKIYQYNKKSKIVTDVYNHSNDFYKLIK